MDKVLVTGGAGFIGSNLISELLRLNLKVICLDNLSTGNQNNISEFHQNPNFKFFQGDILDFKFVKSISIGTDAIFHQAALGSVPRSINDPITSSKVNIEGTLNIFKAAVENKIDKVIYAASSSTYGDSKNLPKKEEIIGKPLSPYAVTKYVNELYADVFKNIYGLNSIGLRYFNVFGPKQDPNGPYAAVIPLFINLIIKGKSPTINGDGTNTRDFTYVENAVQANIKALNAPISAYNKVYNIACGEKTSLNELFLYLKKISKSDIDALYGSFREGDVKHSLADITKAMKLLNYKPSVSVKEGLKKTFEWYKEYYG